MMNNDFISKTHCVFKLTFHVIFITKFIKQVFSPDILKDLILILSQLAKDVNTKITEINGESDHIHFLLEITPQDCLGSLIGYLKRKSSSLLQKTYKFPYYNNHSKTL